MTLKANSADDKLMIFFLIFPRKQDLTFHANLHEMSKPVSGKNKKKKFNKSSAENFTQSTKRLVAGAEP